jgi:hypothetical protein
MLARQPRNPTDAIVGFASLVAKLSPPDRAAWVNAESREFDIGIQAGFDPFAAEWVLERGVIEAVARLGGRVRLTVYAAELPSGPIVERPREEKGRRSTTMMLATEYQRSPSLS